MPGKGPQPARAVPRNQRYPSKDKLPSHQAQREKLTADIAAFLADGGEIEQIAWGVSGSPFVPPSKKKVTI